MVPPSKRPRRRQEADPCSYCAKRKHLYLVTGDKKGGHPGYAIHKLDADDMPEHLPEPALRIAAPECGPIAFAAVGANIFVATNPHRCPERALPTLVYDTETAALTLGPRLPDGYVGYSAPMAVDERLYDFMHEYDELHGFSLSLQVLSCAPASQLDAWDPDMAWSWSRAPPPPPSLETGMIITSYALHPDGRTIFMSTDRSTWSFDTGNRAWRELGKWVLPFSGQAHFDADLDAWVGLHHEEKGYVCCCPVASRSAAAAARRQPECTVLKEKLFRSDDEKHPNARNLKATLTYMGDSRFCLVENVLDADNYFEGELRVTLFGLKYDQKGELRTKVHRTTRSYPLSKVSPQFSHAAFWM